MPIKSETGTYWRAQSYIIPLQYVPHPPEPVVGIVIARHAEGFRVDIGASQAASLDALAFEGATKRNKPNLKVSWRKYLIVARGSPSTQDCLLTRA